MDENPYEPPRTSQPIKRATIVKRGAGVALILLLTPPAIVATVAASCAAVTAYPPVTIYLPVIAPLVVLTSLMILAAYLDRRRPEEPNSQLSRAGLFLATPVVVFLASVIGFGAAAFVFHATSIQTGGADESGMWATIIAFWTLPTIALVTMLFIAWKAGR